VSDAPWTIRLDGSGIASRDNGETALLDAETLAILRRLTRGLHTDLRQPTATTHASIAEARQATPQPGVGPPINETTVADVGAETIPLGPLTKPLDRSFGEVLAGRQSERTLQPLELGDLATLLVHGARVRGWHQSDDGYQMTSRPSPSAGARHPYELMVVVQDVATVAPGLWLFDPARCCLVHRTIDHCTLQTTLAAVNAATGLERSAPATVFVVAHFERTLNRYPAGSTLVWRDLGAVASTLHLVASAAGLASCIVGTAGVLESEESQLRTDGIALVVGKRRGLA